MSQTYRTTTLIREAFPAKPEGQLEKKHKHINKLPGVGHLTTRGP